MSTKTNVTGAPNAAGDRWVAEPSERNLIEILRLLRRNWLTLLLCGLAALGGAWWYFQNQVPQYRAQALLQRKADVSPIETLGLPTWVPNQPSLGSQLPVIRSRRVLGGAVDSEGLRLVIRTPVGARGGVIAEAEVGADAESGDFQLLQAGPEIRLVDAASGRVVTSGRAGMWLFGPEFGIRLQDDVRLEGPVEFTIVERENAIVSVREDLRVESPELDLLRLTYTSPDPVLTVVVVNAVARSYQGYVAEQAREGLIRQRNFLSEQLVLVADSLAVEQTRLQQYQSDAGLIDPAIDAQAIMDQRIAAEIELDRFRFEEGVLQSAFDAMASGGDTENAFQRVMALGASLLPGGEGLYDRLSGLRAERLGLTVSRFGYTERQPQVERLDSLIQINQSEMRDAVDRSLTLLGERRATAALRVEALRQQVQDLPSQLAPYTRQQRRVEAVQEMFSRLTIRYYEAQMAAEVETGDIEIVDHAEVPRSPLPTQEAAGLAIALLIGLSLGCGIAFLREELDTILRTPSQVRKASGLEILAMVPRATLARGNGASQPVPVLDDSQLGAEAFRALRTMLRFVRSERPRVIGVTSPIPGSGKTTVSVNLAAVLAQQGASVLLIDADLRRPALHRVLGRPQVPGLTDVLVGEVEVGDVVRDLSEDDFRGTAGRTKGLSFLAAGNKSPNPAELLGGESFKLLIERALEQFDTVIIDTAPVLAVTDAAVVGAVGDGLLMVIGADETDREALREAVGQLRQVRVPLLGLVINKVRQRKGYYGYYSSDYGQDYESFSGDGRGGERPNRLRRMIGLSK